MRIVHDNRFYREAVTAVDDGGPVHPDQLHAGISLRDYFAAKAMQGLIVDPERGDQSRWECARLAYLMADAMLIARKA